MKIDPKKIICLLMKHYGMSKDDIEAGVNEVTLFNIIVSMLDNTQRVIFDLDFADPFEEHDLYESEDEDQDELPAKQPKSDITSYSMDQLKEIVNKSETWSLKTITHRWPHVKSFAQIERYHF